MTREGIEQAWDDARREFIVPNIVKFAAQIHDKALEEAAERGIDRIIVDMTDRRSFRQVWSEIDEEIRQEIISEWGNRIRALKIGEK